MPVHFFKDPLASILKSCTVVPPSRMTMMPQPQVAGFMPTPEQPGTISHHCHQQGLQFCQQLYYSSIISLIKTLPS